MSEAPMLDASLPAPRAGRCDVLIIAGEHSGDQHAARMARKLFAEKADIQLCALGGEALEAEGVQLLHDLTASSVVGVVEVLKNYGYFKRLFEKTVAWIREYKPKAVCFVDYPGFNLRLAKRLVAEGIACKGGGRTRLLYYISPQVWAWKKKRRFRMAELLDALAVIFPFEVEVFADTSLPVTFVGHPFTQEDYVLPLSYDASAPVLLLPGSRREPVRRIFPLMLAGWESFIYDNPSARAQVIHPSKAVADVIESCLAGVSAPVRESITLGEGGAVEASAVLSSSGTMSLNVALAGIPGAIVYRAHPLTYFLGRMLIDIEYLGIANILLNRPAWPEYIQGAAKPHVLAERLRVCQKDKQAREQAKASADELIGMLSAQAECTPHAWLMQAMQ